MPFFQLFLMHAQNIQIKVVLEAFKVTRNMFIRFACTVCCHQHDILVAYVDLVQLGLIPLGENLKEELIVVVCDLDLRKVAHNLGQDDHDIISILVFIHFNLLSLLRLAGLQGARLTSRIVRPLTRPAFLCQLHPL